MTAIEAITILKRIPFTSGIPIVVLTAETAPQLKTKALKAGATEYLLKPIPPRDLLNVIRRVCRPARFKNQHPTGWFPAPVSLVLFIPNVIFSDKFGFAGYCACTWYSVWVAKVRA
jgi:Response regulator receiver domain